jgi:hypothetical protein
LLNLKPVGFHKKAFIREWSKEECVTFFDLIGCELDPSEKLVCSSKKKKMYGYSLNCSPLKLVNYCFDMNLLPLGYVMKIPITRDEAGEVVHFPYTEPALGLNQGLLTP